MPLNNVKLFGIFFSCLSGQSMHRPWSSAEDAWHPRHVVLDNFKSFQKLNTQKKASGKYPSFLIATNSLTRLGDQNKEMSFKNWVNKEINVVAIQTKNATLRKKEEISRSELSFYALSTNAALLLNGP